MQGAEPAARGHRVPAPIDEQVEVVRRPQQALQRAALEVRVVGDAGLDRRMRDLKQKRIEHDEVEAGVARDLPAHRFRADEQPFGFGLGREHRLAHGPSSVASPAADIDQTRRTMTIQTLSDEQRAFVEAIRDFAQRECGTREQRDALTDNGREPHNQELYERIAELGWPGVCIPEEYGGSGRRRRRHVPDARGDRSRPDPDGVRRGDDDHRRRGAAVRQRRAQGGDPRGYRKRAGRVHRDVRARGRVRRRAICPAGPSAPTAAT